MSGTRAGIGRSRPPSSLRTRAVMTSFSGSSETSLTAMLGELMHETIPSRGIVWHMRVLPVSLKYTMKALSSTMAPNAADGADIWGLDLGLSRLRSVRLRRARFRRARLGAALPRSRQLHALHKVVESIPGFLAFRLCGERLSAWPHSTRALEVAVPSHPTLVGHGCSNQREFLRRGPHHLSVDAPKRVLGGASAMTIARHDSQRIQPAG